MKKILLFACLFAFVGLSNVSAQCAKTASSKSCAKTCAKTAATADKAADMDDNIVKRLDDEGNAFFVRKAVDSESGKVTFTDVKYCTDSKAFINKSPSQVASAKAVKVSDKAAKMSCSKKEGKSCCASKSKVASTTATAKEAVQPQAIMVKQVEKN
jgi:phosphatidate phosphatase PAH1